MTALPILHVLRAPIGGLFRHVRDLAIEQSRRGHQVGVLCDASTGDALTDEKLEQLNEALAFGVTRTPMSRGLAVSDLSAVRTTRRLIIKHNIGIVHGHGAKGGAYARIAARLTRSRPVSLYTPHGGSLHYPVQSPQGMVFHNLERVLDRMGDGTIFESQFAARKSAATVGTPKRPRRIIPNGLGTTDFQPLTSSPCMAAEHDVAFVGELRQLKGVDILLHALSQLNDHRHPDAQPFTAVIAGDGPDRDELHALASELGLDEHVTFTGPRPAREIFTLGRCVAIPSRAESFPYVVLEAAAAGRPVIATTVGGIPEMVAGTRQELIEPNNPDQLASAIANIRANPELAQCEAQKLREHVQTKFSVSTMADNTSAFYEELIARRNSGAEAGSPGPHSGHAPSSPAKTRSTR